jgi:hypothetical protein
MYHISSDFISVPLICSDGDEILDNVLAFGEQCELERCPTFGGFLLERVGKDGYQMLEQSNIFWCFRYLVGIVEDSTMECEFALGIQPCPDGLVESLPCVLESFDSLVVLVFFGEFFVSSHWSIAHEPFDGLDTSNMRGLNHS